MKVVKYINNERIEPIDADSLEDAFEVVDDAIEDDFKSINNFFDNLFKKKK